MLVPDDEPEKLEAAIVPSTVRLRTAPPVALELVRAKVVAEESTRSMVYVPDAVLLRVVSDAAMVRTLFPESKVRVLVVDDMVRAPESVMLLVPKVCVPMVVVAAKLPTPVDEILTVPAPAPVAIDVTALNVPGALRSDGRERVTAPVDAEAVI